MLAPMGTWGPGNFDDDTAADHLSSVSARLVEEIEAAMAGDPVALEPDEYAGVAVPCNVELLALLAEQKWAVSLPHRETVLAWKETYLAVWDRTIEGLSPVSPKTKDAEAAARWSTFKKARREVLVRTFDRLADRCEPAPPPKARRSAKTRKG